MSCKVESMLLLFVLKSLINCLPYFWDKHNFWFIFNQTQNHQPTMEGDTLPQSYQGSNPERNDSTVSIKQQQQIYIYICPIITNAQSRKRMLPYIWSLFPQAWQRKDIQMSFKKKIVINDLPKSEKQKGKSKLQEEFLPNLPPITRLCCWGILKAFWNKWLTCL